MAKRVGNFLVVLVIGFLLYQRIPTWIEQYKQQDFPAPSTSIQRLEDQQAFQIPLHGRSQLLVFWATWCGPCTIELGRIQRLINLKKIDATQVVAISSGENIETIKQHLETKDYTFPIAVDLDYSAAKAYNVKGTPTLALIDSKGIVTWMTMGLSPSLELRLLEALNPKE